MTAALAIAPIAFGFGLALASLDRDIPRAISAYRALSRRIEP